MRCKHVSAIGLLLALPVLCAGLRVDAGGPLCGHADCPSQDTTVRLPAQEIRIETSRPRVVVNEVQTIGRARHGFAYAAGFPMGYGPAFMPMPAGQPFVASFYVPANTTPDSRGSAASGTVRALQDLEAQAFEVARQKAILKAETDHVNMMHKRISASLAASLQGADNGPTDTTSLQKSIDDLSKRISDVERLLLIHDNALKDVLKNKTRQ
jgi:hypothetical protein